MTPGGKALGPMSWIIIGKCTHIIRMRKAVMQARRVAVRARKDPSRRSLSRLKQVALVSRNIISRPGSISLSQTDIASDQKHIAFGRSRCLRQGPMSVRLEDTFLFRRRHVALRQRDI